MKPIYIIFFFLFCSCQSYYQKSDNQRFADSLLAHFSLPKTINNQVADLEFWKNRIDPKLPGQVSESRYASALVKRFQNFGDIQDLYKADSILRKVNSTYNNTLASPFSALTSIYIMQHRFSVADSMLTTAKKLGIDGYTFNTLSFDVDFELGHYSQADFFLNKLKRNADYSYLFRKSKMDHLNGEIDSAISEMIHAGNLVKNNPYLRGIALSNAGDLFIHTGNFEKASEIYKECIRLNVMDFHSMQGLAWILLMKDGNDSLARKIFLFVKNKNKLPYAYYKLYQWAQKIQDKKQELMYASLFERLASNSLYRKMYNKYLIELYTGILFNYPLAEKLSKDELANRATPQSYTWYAYSLYKNSKPDQAYSIFKKYVSGKPLEGLELYYIGELLKGMNKGYDASEFFKAAQKNDYDLSPFIQKAIEKNLNE